MKKQSNKTKKRILKKIFIKICRITGYELIDQSNFSVPTQNKKLGENLSIQGKKSISLPMGETKITRKVKSLTVIFRSCTNVNMLTQNKTRLFASYIIMLQSNIAIGTISTMLGEYLALGGKILACNFSKIGILDYPIKGICFIKNSNFEEFEKKLTNIFSVSKKEYFSQLNKRKDYIVKYNNKDSTIKMIRNQIIKAIR